MTPPSIIIVTGLAVVMAACAAGPTASDRPGPSALTARGQVVAERECASCHAVGPQGESRWAAAPPFRVIRMRYNDISFEHKMRAVAAEGHYEMPPMRLETDDVRAVSAYIESLGTP